MTSHVIVDVRAFTAAPIRGPKKKLELVAPYISVSWLNTYFTIFKNHLLHIILSTTNYYVMFTRHVNLRNYIL